MNQTQLTQLRDIAKELHNTYDRINSGGCGAVAAMLGKHILRMTDKIMIVSVGGSKSIDEARKEINCNVVGAWESAGVGFYHVWVEFKCGDRWYAIDSDGVKRRTNMHSIHGTPPKGSFTVNEMRKLGDSHNWNCVFDRSQLYSMKNIVGRRFNAILN